MLRRKLSKWKNDETCGRCGRRARSRFGIVVCTNPKCLAVYHWMDQTDPPCYYCRRWHVRRNQLCLVQ